MTAPWAGRVPTMRELIDAINELNKSGSAQNQAEVEELQEAVRRLAAGSATQSTQPVGDKLDETFILDKSRLA